MSDLLSKDEYADIAAKIKFPIDPFINGKFQKTKAGIHTVKRHPVRFRSCAPLATWSPRWQPGRPVQQRGRPVQQQSCPVKSKVGSQVVP